MVHICCHSNLRSLCLFRLSVYWSYVFPLYFLLCWQSSVWVELGPPDVSCLALKTGSVTKLFPLSRAAISLNAAVSLSSETPTVLLLILVILQYNMHMGYWPVSLWIMCVDLERVVSVCVRKALTCRNSCSCLKQTENSLFSSEVWCSGTW